MSEVGVPFRPTEMEFKAHERQMIRLEAQQRIEEIRRRIEERKKARLQRHMEEAPLPADALVDQIDKLAPGLSDEAFYKSVLILETQLDLDDKTDSEQSPNVGWFSQVAEGVGTIVSYMNPLGWFAGKNEATETPETDFKCVHINWYGRRLRRNFRFEREEFHRLHPETGDIRASRPYSDISEIKIESPNSFTIKYKDGGYSDSIEVSTNDAKKIMGILSCHLPELITEMEVPNSPNV